MHFVWVDRSCKVSWGTTYPLLLGEALAQRGHRFTFAARGGAVDAQMRQAGISRLRTLPWPLNLPQVTRYLRAYPPDIFLCTGRGRARRAALTLAQRFNRPCVGLVIDKLKPGQGIEDFLAPDCLVTMSPLSYEALLGLGVSPDRFKLWPRVIRTRPLAPPPPEGFHIVCIGRLSQRKAVAAALLIETIPQLASRIAGLTVSVVGSGGGTGRLVAAARQVNQLCGRDIVSTYPEASDPLAWMERANLVVAGGNTALEACYSGRPTIACGFAWAGVVSRERLPEVERAFYGERTTEERTADKMGAAVLEVYEALQDPLRAASYQPGPHWYSGDHTAGHAAVLMEALGKELLVSRGISV